MSYFLVHLPSGWHVDQAILTEEERVVCIRFGSDADPTCMKMDETLYGIAERVKNFCQIFLVDIKEVPDFNKVSTGERQGLAWGRREARGRRSGEAREGGQVAAHG
jgi:hypothetical protein